MLEPIYLKPTSAEEHALLQRFHKGEHTQADLDSLREIMRQNPGRLSRATDLCELVFQDAIELAVGDGVLVGELIKDRREVLRASLGYTDALPVERLLIDEIAMAWLRHHTTEIGYTAVRQGDCSLAQGNYWEKRLAASQRRYLRAIETYVRVGKLLRSVSVQVNIGEKQVNVAG